LAYHNLGMVSADRGRLSAADCYFRESRALAERVGDVYLRGLCLVNHAEVDVMRQRFEDARQRAEEALALFDQLGARSAKADAYRVIGMVYRETGRTVLADSRLPSTTWASCGSRTSCFASRGRSRARSARWCRCIRSGGSSCWRASSSPGT